MNSVRINIRLFEDNEEVQRFCCFRCLTFFCRHKASLLLITFWLSYLIATYYTGRYDILLAPSITTILYIIYCIFYYCFKGFRTFIDELLDRDRGIKKYDYSSEIKELVEDLIKEQSQDKAFNITTYKESLRTLEPEIFIDLSRFAITRIVKIYQASLPSSKDIDLPNYLVNYEKPIKCLVKNYDKTLEDKIVNELLCDQQWNKILADACKIFQNI
jgi:hypothetical protein